MKGINLKIDKSTITGMIDSNNYSLSVSLTIRHFEDEEQISLIFSGYNKDEDKQLTYFADHFFGDKIDKEIKIKLIENDENSSLPIKELKYDQSSNNEMLLRSYRRLQAQLKEKGLI
ncbi:hypothetical protein [Algoriphagus namhaensis]